MLLFLIHFRCLCFGFIGLGSTNRTCMDISDLDRDRDSQVETLLRFCYVTQYIYISVVDDSAEAGLKPDSKVTCWPLS